MSKSYIKFVENEILNMLEMKRFRAAGLGINKWRRAAPFVAAMVEEESKSKYAKAGAAIMKAALLTYNCGQKIDWMLLDAYTPLVVYVGSKCQLEVRRDAAGNMYFRIVDSGYIA